MAHFKEWLILWIVLGLSIGILVYCLRKKHTTEWLLVFFINAYISSLLDNYLVQSGYFEYPVRFISNKFDTSLVFDYFTFPVLAIIYNQTSYSSKLGGIIVQAVLYSGTLAFIEYWLERDTLLIKYHNHWSWIYTFSFFILTFLVVRGAMGLIRKVRVKS